MYEPNGWHTSPLIQLLEKVIDYRGQSVPKATNGIPLITARNVKQGFLDLTDQEYVDEPSYESWMNRGMPKNGDILFTTEAPLGNACRFPEDKKYAVGQRTVTLRSNEKLHPDFLLYFLLSAHGQRLIDLRSTGSTAKGIKSSELKKIKVLYPISIYEQQKIAQILSTWDKAIEKLEALIATKQKRKKALMQQLLTGKMRFSEFVKSEGIQKTKFGTIPSDWQYLHIADVAKQFSVKNNAGHDLPVLSCTKHYGLVDSLSYFGKQIFSEDTSTYKVVLRNSFAYATNHIEEGSIGYQNLYDKALISPMYTVFQTTENINDQFLYRLLKTELYRHIFEVNTSASVDRRGSLRWDQFSAIKIPVPSIPEQQKIASFFAVTDTEIQTHQKQLSALKEQKKGLMQQLLTGKKRVKVDGHV